MKSQPLYLQLAIFCTYSNFISSPPERFSTLLVQKLPFNYCSLNTLFSSCEWFRPFSSVPLCRFLSIKPLTSSFQTINKLKSFSIFKTKQNQQTNQELPISTVHTITFPSSSLLKKRNLYLPFSLTHHSMLG